MQGTLLDFYRTHYGIFYRLRYPPQLIVRLITRLREFYRARYSVA